MLQIKAHTHTETQAQAQAHKLTQYEHCATKLATCPGTGCYS